MPGRTYQLKKRAEKQAETRRRIVEAIVGLHQEVGPARTTVSAIAERAGVERLTVYRHFPEEADQIAACSAHWAALHPRPDIGAWRQVADPIARFERALSELYAFFDHAEPMWTNILRDAPQVPALQPTAAAIAGFFAAARAILSAGLPDDPLLRAALGHAVQLESWRSLVRGQGLADAQAVELLTRWVLCLRESSEYPPTQP